MEMQLAMVRWCSGNQVVRSLVLLVPKTDPDGDLGLLGVLWQAGNRIQSTSADVLTLPRWAQVLRWNLEFLECRSLQVGDEIMFDGGGFDDARTWVCEPVGWRQTHGRVA